jgi:hypothetical protein
MPDDSLNEKQETRTPLHALQVLLWLTTGSSICTMLRELILKQDVEKQA